MCFCCHDGFVGSKGGALVRALASHQCGLGSIPGPGRRHVWVEFVVGSLLAPRCVSPVTSVFPSPQKLTFLNSNSFRNPRATGLSVARLLGATLVEQSR